MSSNIREFTLALDRYGAGIPEEVAKRHRAVALEGLRGLVQMTPVDTGRARANWSVTHDAPANFSTLDLDKNGAATITAGSAVIATAEPYSVTWITNNLEYIEELEKGHSQQAPAGMLNVTFNRLKSWLSRKR